MGKNKPLWVETNKSLRAQNTPLRVENKENNHMGHKIDHLWVEQKERDRATKWTQTVLQS